MFHLLLRLLQKNDLCVMNECRTLLRQNYTTSVQLCLCHVTRQCNFPCLSYLRQLGLKMLVQSTPFFILVIDIVHVSGAMGLPWNVITPHTSPNAHGIQLAGSRSSTLILRFKIDCKHVTCTCQNFVGVHHGIQSKFNDLIYLFQNEAQNSNYLSL